MIDILERLRRYAGDMCISTTTEIEAADIIEGLRAENETLAANMRGKHSTAGATYAHLIAERDALRAEIAAMKQQEPLYLFRRKGLDDFCTCSKERYEAFSANPRLFEVKTLYALPGAKGEEK